MYLLSILISALIVWLEVTHLWVEENYNDWHKYTFPIWHAMLIAIILLVPVANIMVTLAFGITVACLSSTNNVIKFKLGTSRFEKFLTKPLL